MFMDKEDQEKKIKELTGKVELLSSIIIKAQMYADVDPEIALMQARKSAEAICRNIFTVEIGEPGKIMLDELIKKLAEKKIIPTKILIPLGTIQAYGNYGSHAQSEAQSIDPGYVVPCLSAMAQLVDWYFTEYLKIDVPQGIHTKITPRTNDSVITNFKDQNEQITSDKHIQSPALPRSGENSYMHNKRPAGLSKKKYYYGIVLIVAMVSFLGLFLLYKTRDISKDNTTYLVGKDSTADLENKGALETALGLKKDKQSTTQENIKTTPQEKQKGSILQSANNPIVIQETHKNVNENVAISQKSPDTINNSVSPAPSISDQIDPPINQMLSKQPVVLKEGTLEDNKNYEGEATALVLIEKNGKVSKVRVQSLSNENFRKLAVDLAKKYLFSPAEKNNSVVRAWASIKIIVKPIN